MVGGIRNRNLKGQARSALALLAFVAACFGAALVGTIFTAPSVPEWYGSFPSPRQAGYLGQYGRCCIWQWLSRGGWYGAAKENHLLLCLWRYLEASSCLTSCGRFCSLGSKHRE